MKSPSRQGHRSFAEAAEQFVTEVNALYGRKIVDYGRPAAFIGAGASGGPGRSTGALIVSGYNGLIYGCISGGGGSTRDPAFDERWALVDTTPVPPKTRYYSHCPCCGAPRLKDLCDYCLVASPPGDC